MGTAMKIFNLREGTELLSKSDREAHPGAEYFTAERAVSDREAADGVKRVELVFRKIATENGVFVKSGEKFPLAAGVLDGKTVVFKGSSRLGEEILGVCVRKIFSFE